MLVVAAGFDRIAELAKEHATLKEHWRLCLKASSDPHELFRKESDPKGHASQAHPAFDPRSNPRPSDEQKSSRVSLKPRRRSVGGCSCLT
jgi:hypothetical protein